ncbi:amidohydrolase [Brenneria goodwinii]|uniref:M20 family metallopeptidase n=1 Tax=Brenneria goodwinii TaxID=1109412 RepID=UPI000EF200DA|nr:M20 family metallopeptidase [Brenneria goodwinii]MCG8158173.1 amidohydrolase [Brenneria goodwinii]MCG8162651.1 amidohydrolase [Brenneria goodwinii]MCG8167223.1 amidohydrolase [Brenneria goodwinii]MCG8171941.1 amidohydrolase [Brenneria goodwinii]MCG8176673.1 amidohydrolase [Brenneria goodwinii]
MNLTQTEETLPSIDRSAVEEICGLIAAKRQQFCTLSDAIWDTPELNYEEYRSSAQHEAVLKAEGFRLTTGIAGMPTALLGEFGSGSPVIAFLGEYDALPGLSQEANVAEPRPLENGGNGHGCGHNLLGSASLQAATAVKDYLQKHALSGTVRFYGCPAEEGGSSKGFMVKAGVFDDVDIAICWHPAAFTGVNSPVSLACNELNFYFKGRASHAASSPHLGRSALDAVELMNVGVNYMREHMPSSARVHYAVTDSGGHAPNVVQANATVRYLVRARQLPELHNLVSRVKKIAEGAALMTETEVRYEVLSGDANLLGNSPLEHRMHEHLLTLGPIEFDEQDRQFAAKFQAAMTAEDITSSYARFGLKPQPGQALHEEVYPLYSPDPAFIGSTDVGTVSWVVPTVQVRCATYAIGTPAHSWQLVAQGKAPAAHKGMEYAAKAMASLAIDLFMTPDLIKQAKADLQAQLAQTPFENPIPDDVSPPLPQ